MSSETNYGEAAPATGYARDMSKLEYVAALIFSRGDCTARYAIGQAQALLGELKDENQ